MFLSGKLVVAGQVETSDYPEKLYISVQPYMNKWRQVFKSSGQGALSLESHFAFFHVVIFDR